jgi:hypothetical protein
MVITPLFFGVFYSYQPAKAKNRANALLFILHGQKDLDKSNNEKHFNKKPPMQISCAGGLWGGLRDEC